MLPLRVPWRLRVRCRDAPPLPSTSTSSVPSTKTGKQNKKTRKSTRAKAAPSKPREAKADSSNGKGRSTNWRHQMKETNPGKYTMIQEQGRNYSKFKRLEMSLAKSDLKKRNLPAAAKDKAHKLVEDLKKYNAGCASRMRKMRIKKKEELKNNPPMKLTRTQKQQKKKKDAIIAKKRRVERASMTPAAKDAYLEHRRCLYAKNKERETILIDNLTKQRKELDDEKRRLAELANDVNEERLALEQQRIDMRAEGEDARSSGARRKRLQRVRRAMPKQAAEYVNTTADLIDKASPKKASLLKKRDLTTTKDKMLEFAVFEAVSANLAEPKQSAARRSMGSSLSIMKKYSLQRRAAARFGVSRKLISKAKKQSAGRKNLPQSTINAVQEFYESISSSLPDKKMVSKKTGQAMKLMDKSIKPAYYQFTKAHPDIQISVSTFFKLRPRHVKTRQQATYRGCLCEYCANITLKLKVINAHLVCARAPTFQGMYDMSNATLCKIKPPCTVFHHPECIQRTCKKCGVDKLDEKLAPLIKQGPKLVKWQQWDLVSQTVQKGTSKSEVKKRALVTKTGDLQQLIADLKSETNTICEHLFNKDWQNGQLQTLRNNLPPATCLCILDFAENYKCGYQDEVQSAYWSQNAATVHPIVTYYKCDRCPENITESLIFISNDLTHDYHAVNAFQIAVCNHLQDVRGLKLEKVYRFSDGCGQQYKSKGPFSDLSYGKSDFGVTLHHNFSGSRHGKGASDGESAVVKSAASRAVKAGSVIISNAEELFNYGRDNLTKTSVANACTHFIRTFFYIPSGTINRERTNRHVKTVNGTMKLHSIKTVQDGVVATRNLSCFCPACLQETGHCQNSQYVHSWEKVSLCTITKTANKSQSSAAVSQKVAPVPVPTQDATSDAANNIITSAAVSPSEKVAPVPVPTQDATSDAANNINTSAAVSPSEKVAPVPVPTQDATSDAANNINTSAAVSLSKKVAPVPVPTQDATSDAANNINTSAAVSPSQNVAPVPVPTQDATSDADTIPWSVGSWVLAEYDGIHYPGRVMSILETESQLECMTSSGAYWKWPVRKDVAWYPKTSIIKQLRPPVPVSASRGNISMFPDLTCQAL